MRENTGGSCPRRSCRTLAGWSWDRPAVAAGAGRTGDPRRGRSERTRRGPRGQCPLPARPRPAGARGVLGAATHSPEPAPLDLRRRDPQGGEESLGGARARGRARWADPKPPTPGRRRWVPTAAPQVAPRPGPVAAFGGRPASPAPSVLRGAGVPPPAPTRPGSWGARAAGLSRVTRAPRGRPLPGRSRPRPPPTWSLASPPGSRPRRGLGSAPIWARGRVLLAAARVRGGLCSPPPPPPGSRPSSPGTEGAGGPGLGDFPGPGFISAPWKPPERPRPGRALCDRVMAPL